MPWERSGAYRFGALYRLFVIAMSSATGGGKTRSKVQHHPMLSAE